MSQTATSENLEQRDAVIDSLIATFAAGTTISARDRVVLDGRTYDVDGDPHVCWTPRGAHHIEVTLKAVTG